VKRPPPRPPYPDLMRQPKEGFGWLEDRLLRDRWLADLGPEGVAVLVLLALAADRHGASYFSRPRMAAALDVDVRAIDAALHRMLDLRLVAFRPWQSGERDGVWQLLPVPKRKYPVSTQGPATAGEVFRELGILKPR